MGRSEAIRRLLQRIERVGPTEATVLIQGERGTGKELVAAAVHEASRRRERPYVTLNCAALPVDLLASELFGHERGAFTGAMERRQGLLAAADTGTVFLDEIGDLSPQGQAMLLRFLQEREVRPLGAPSASRIDVRVITATNADLAEAVARKAFRADLYDRLAEVVLTVPPLRERAGDIPELAQHFVAVHARRHGHSVRGLAPGALALVRRWPWSGNVRELEQCISRAVVFATGPLIVAEDLELTDGAVTDVRLTPGCDLPNPGLSPRQKRIEALARSYGIVRRGEVAARFGISGETARRDLGTLVRLGILQRAGRHRGCRYVSIMPSGPTGNSAASVPTGNGDWMRG